MLGCRWKQCGISDHLFPPEYLIRIICGYYINEFVHLIGDMIGIENGQHYKINVFDIMNC